MAKVTRFEDLRCWQAARELVKFTYPLCSHGKLTREFELTGQLKRACLSSMNNIAEGFARYHTRDSIRFYDMAQSSAAEVLSMTYAIDDLKFLEPKEISELKSKAEKTRNLTLGFIKYLDDRTKPESESVQVEEPETGYGKSIAVLTDIPSEHLNTVTPEHANTVTPKHKTTSFLSIILFILSLTFEFTLKAQEFKIRLGSVVPQDSPWETALKEYTTYAEQKSGGKLKFRMYLGGQLGGEVEMVKGVALGTLEAGAFSNAAVAEGLSIPELQAFEMPFLFNSDEEADAIMDAMFQYISDILAKKGVILIMWGTNGWRNFGCKKVAITKPADMKGLKMRSQESEVYVNLYKTLGAVPVPIQTPEVLVALKTGMVDGFDQTPIFSVSTGWITSVKSYTVTKHIYQPGAVIVSKKFYDKLPADLKSIVISPEKRVEFTKKSRSVVRTEDNEVLSTIETNFGTKVIQLTDVQRAEFKKAAQPVYASMEKIIGAATMQKVNVEIANYRKVKK